MVKNYINFITSKKLFENVEITDHADDSESDVAAGDMDQIVVEHKTPKAKGSFSLTHKCTFVYLKIKFIVALPSSIFLYV